MHKLKCSKQVHNHLYKNNKYQHRTFFLDLIVKWEYWGDGDKVKMYKRPTHLLKLYTIVMYIPALLFHGVVNYKQVNKDFKDVWLRKPFRSDQVTLDKFNDSCRSGY
jgi:hypothetical protein